MHQHFMLVSCASFVIISRISLLIKVNWVKAKIKSLRTSYTRSKKQASSGSSRKNPTKRASWLAEKLQFLEPFVAIGTPISIMDSVSIF
jgi:hypothetical protein